MCWFSLLTYKRKKTNWENAMQILSSSQRKIVRWKGQTRNRHACCVLFEHILTYTGAFVWSSWLCLRLASDRQEALEIIRRVVQSDGVRGCSESDSRFHTRRCNGCDEVQNVKVEVHDRREAQSVLFSSYPQPYLFQASIFRLQQIYGLGKRNICICMYVYVYVCTYL